MLGGFLGPTLFYFLLVYTFYFLYYLRTKVIECFVSLWLEGASIYGNGEGPVFNRFNVLSKHHVNDKPSSSLLLLPSHPAQTQGVRVKSDKFRVPAPAPAREVS